MKKTVILLVALILTYAVNAQSKVENIVKQRTEELTEVLQLTKTEKSQVFKILLEKELKTAALRTEYKSDPDTKKAAIKKINPIYNRQIKDAIGKERMATYNEYKKSKRKKK
ncbi:MAG: hypothetical protein COB81_10995 [Flavobacteriaceae bacterium]|nr:MAG: hypothetical protein COB81_10995 [Flavobacteriaceae bacterium]